MDDLETTVNEYRELDDNSGSSSYATKCDEAYARLKQIKDILVENEDTQGIKYLDELLDKAEGYVSSVVKMKLSPMQLLRMETRDMQEKVTEKDRARKLKHNALISQLQIFNRYLFKNYAVNDEVPVGGVYSLPPDTLSADPADKMSTNARNVIGDWAGYVILGIFTNRDQTK